jgi:hypothetical protein
LKGVTDEEQRNHKQAAPHAEMPELWEAHAAGYDRQDKGPQVSGVAGALRVPVRAKLFQGLERSQK